MDLIKDLSFDELNKLSSHDLVKTIEESLRPSSNTNKSRYHLIAYLDQLLKKDLYVLHYRDTHSDGSTASGVIEASTDITKLHKSIIESVIETYGEADTPEPKDLHISGSQHEFTLDDTVYRYLICPITII